MVKSVVKSSFLDVLDYTLVDQGPYTSSLKSHTEDPTTGTLPRLRPTHLTEDPTTGTLQSTQHGAPHLLLSTLSQSGGLAKLGNARRERKKEGDHKYKGGLYEHAQP